MDWTHTGVELKGELIEVTKRAPSLLSEETTITGLMGSGMTVMFPSKKLAHYSTKAIHRTFQNIW